MNHYKTDVILVNEYGWTLTELEEMLPYEKDVRITLLLNHLKEKEERQKQHING